MAEEEKHFPPGAEPEVPAADAPAPEGDKAPEGEKPTAEKPDGEKPEADEEKAPEAEKPKDEPKDPPAPPLPKKRSIYDDLKGTRKEKNAFRDAAVAALEAQGVKLTGNETAEDLQALAKRNPSPKSEEKPKADAPKEEPKPTDELEAFAKENDIDPKSLTRLTEIISKRIPQAQLSEEDKADLAVLKTWRADRARQEEDDAIVAAAPAVKTLAKELGFEIHVEAELAKVMDEVKRLAHTKEFHDKPVDYIVFAKRVELSKLVSPKKASFESGSGNRAEGGEEKVDWGSGKVTPAQAGAAMSTPKASLEIRKAQ